MQVDFKSYERQGKTYGLTETVRSKEHRVGWHTHDFYKIILVTKGEGHFDVMVEGKKEEVPFKENTLLFFDGTLPNKHVDYPHVPFHMLFFGFLPAFLESDALAGDVRTLFTEKAYHVIRDALFVEHVSALFRKALTEQAEQHAAYEHMMRAYLTQVLSEVIRFAHRVTGKDAEESDWRVEQVVAYIRANYRQRITVEECIRDVGLGITRRHFSRIFKEHTGEHFLHYLNRVRIEAAQEELVATNEKIITLLHDVGFDIPSYFAKVFKIATGMSPKEYRKRFKKGNVPPHE